MPQALTTDQIIAALEPVQDPELHRSIVYLDMVRDVRIDETAVFVEIALTVEGCPMKAEIDARVRSAVLAVEGVDSMELAFSVMSEAELSALRVKLSGDGDHQEGAPGQEQQRPIPFAEPGSRTRVLLIASGKGGVGKSSVTANLAVALAQGGSSVAVVDADVWGFSIPGMLGVDQPPVVLDEMLVPPEVHGVRCISMGFFVADEQPVIWRGPMLHKALEQFLTDVYWDEPDFLLVDLPPGTGDVTISMSQYLPRSELYVVTTPQAAAQRVAQRVAFMAEKVDMDLKGVIENMSWFEGDDGKRYEIFGAGGGAELAQRLDVPLLGQIPLVLPLREGADSGIPIVVSAPDNPASRQFDAIAQRIVGELAPTRRTHKELKLL